MFALNREWHYVYYCQSYLEAHWNAKSSADFSLDKRERSNYNRAMSRTYRSAYSKSRAFDPMCRHRKGCPWCEGNRNIQEKRIRDVEKTEKKLDRRQGSE